MIMVSRRIQLLTVLFDVEAESIAGPSGSRSESLGHQAGGQGDILAVYDTIFQINS